MINRAAVIILVAICVGLGIWSITVTKNAAQTRHEAAERVDALSNKWVKADTDLTEQRQVTAELEKDLGAQKKTLNELTNSLAQMTGDLARAEASLKGVQEELKQRDVKITQLETQNQDLETQSTELSSALTNLNVEIAQTQRKLAASEGDKAFLEKELKRMMSEKAELERQFNDLTVLRAQVAKIKEDIAVARRLDWMRRGLYASTEQKGAQRLMQVINPPVRPAQTNYDLNVEINADGSVRVISPSTNAPAGSKP